MALYSSRREHARRYACPEPISTDAATAPSSPPEELITAAVLWRLDTPDFADTLAGRTAQDEHTAELSEALATEQAQLYELTEMWAARQIGRSEWLTARTPIEVRVNDLQRRLHRVIDNDALAGLAGNGTALRQQWDQLNFTGQHASVKAVSTTPQ
jgi:site-specific DNA recombinase